jgi:hypothetical protein
MARAVRWAWDNQRMNASELVDLMADPVWQAEHALRLAAYEAARTDPWRWYCRLCGAEGQADTEADRDLVAFGHVDACPDGCHATVRTESHGRLRHVWSFG